VGVNAGSTVVVVLPASELCLKTASPTAQSPSGG
jgi:hypothetical protein